MSLHHRYHPPAPVLQVSTSVQFDPNEPTARPSNAHVHDQFHHQIAAGIVVAQPTSDSEQQQPPSGLSRSLTAVEQERLDHLDRLKFFLATAPSRWESGSDDSSSYQGLTATSSYHPHHPPAPSCMNRFLLPNQEYVSCVLWNGLYHITGTDIVRALVFRFEAFGRPVRNMKKFEEGVFSDLRNLKPGVDASLEEPKSPFLDLLFKYQAIRTQKKQKVFYWFSVPHDRLFLDALERDLKREKMGLEPTTMVLGEPAQSFRYDPKRGLYEQFCKPARESEGDGDSDEEGTEGDQGDNTMEDNEREEDSEAGTGTTKKKKAKSFATLTPASQFLTFFSEGSPTYKQRRKKGSKSGSSLRKELDDDYGLDGSSSEYERGRTMGPSSNSSSRYSSAHSGSGSRDSSVHSHSRSHSFSSTHGLLQMASSGSFHDPYHGLATTSLHPLPTTMSGHPSAMMTLDTDAFTDRFTVDGRGDLEMVQRPGSSMSSTRPPRPQSMLIGTDAGYHSDIGGQQQYRYPQGHMRGRSLDLAMSMQGSTRHDSLPRGDMQNGTATSFSDTSTPSVPAQHESQANLTPPGALGSSGMSQYESVTSEGNVRAYVCPLFSCSRLFKRMEHLKRHMKTHTMERPFQCSLCKKKFSRRDNLAQHLRTHAHERIAPGAEDANNMEGMGEDSSMGIVSENSSGATGADDESRFMSVYQHSTPPTMDVYAGGVDQADNNLILSGAGSMDLSSFNFDNASGAINYSLLTNQNCEVEIPASGVQDVQGDEEGLLVRTVDDPGLVYRVPSHGGTSTEAYFTGIPTAPPSTASSSTTSNGLFSAPVHASDFATDPSSAPSQWAQVAQNGSTFNTNLSETSATAPSFGSSMLMTHNSQRNILRSMPSNPSIYGTASGNGNMDPYTTASLSAPSHKQSFDHSMYAFEDTSFTGDIGPTRRHRSVTPSLVRAGAGNIGVGSSSGNGVRRPMTSSGGSEYGSPASVHSSLSSASTHPTSARGYHPYASYNSSASNSRAGSTTNSPQLHSIPLRSDSRASDYSSHGASGLHEQMRQMMNMNSNTGEEGMVMRTGSPQVFPFQTDSPAQFHVDLPHMNVHQQHGGFIPSTHAPIPVHSSSLPDAARGQVPHFEGFYPHQQTTTL